MVAKVVCVHLQRYLNMFKQKEDVLITLTVLKPLLSEEISAETLSSWDNY